VKLTTHIHLAPRSKNAWAIHLLPQYSFMAWCSVKKITGTTLLLYFNVLWLNAFESVCGDVRLLIGSSSYLLLNPCLSTNDYFQGGISAKV
jgi:hypothetical protein